MTFHPGTKRNPGLPGLILLGLTLVACGENTKLIGTGSSLTTTPCDTCAGANRPTCASGEVASCFARTDGTCGWADKCVAVPGQSDAGAPTPPPPDAATPMPTPTTDAGPSCPPRVCTAIACPYGNKKDASGCPTCECNPPPSTGCAPVQCPMGQRCELREVMCVRAPCDPQPTCVPETAPNPCAAALCPAGTVCRVKPVVCVTAPCPPVAECVPQVSCGGFSGKPCPGSGTCQDDPTDSCNPTMGGADCIGMCVCKQPAECPPDRIWDNSPAICACVKVP